MEKSKGKWFIVLLCLLVLSPCYCHAQLKMLSDKALSSITGMGAVDFSILGSDTARFYFDIHAEIYAEIDSIKLGYYEKADLTTRKFLAPEDPHVFDNGDGTFDIKENNEIVCDNSPYYVHVDNGGVTHKIPYCDNDFYQYKYKNMLGDYYVDGAQGLNDVNMLGEKFSSQRSVNKNNFDWDINIENLRIGTSPSDPMVIDGLVLQLKYDNIDSSDKKLTDIIIGTNSMEGDFYGDFKRITGYVNSKMPHKTRNTDLIFNSIFIKEFNEVPTPVSLKRDSFLMLVDHYRAEYDNPDDVNTPVPADPTNNNIHTGMFLRIGLDRSSDHYGFAIIAGYNEIVANAYAPKNEMLKVSIRDWWDN